MIKGPGRRHRMAGKGAMCGAKWLRLCHGSSHPKRLMESVQLLLEGIHSQKIHVLYAKSNAWIMPLMISRSGESLRPRINVMRTVTLSMNHTPRRSRKPCGLHTRACKITTSSSCAILRSPGSHRSYTIPVEGQPQKLPWSFAGSSNQTIQKRPEPCLGCSKAASEAPTNRRQGGGKMKNWRLAWSFKTASMTSKLRRIPSVRSRARSYCRSLIAVRPFAPMRR